MSRLRLPLTACLFACCLGVVAAWFGWLLPRESVLGLPDARSSMAFARELAEGALHVDTPATRLRAATNAAPAGAATDPTLVRMQDGRYARNLPIGAPLLQSWLLRLGGLPAALSLRLLAWFLALGFAFLLLREGLGRDGLACATAASAVAAVPAVHLAGGFDPSGWRDPVGLACLAGSAWLLLRYRRTHGWLDAMGTGFFAGFAVAIGDAYLFALLPWLAVFLAALAHGVRGKAGPRFGQLAVAITFLAIGLLPWLVQNHLVSGHLLSNPRTEAWRETLRAGLATDAYLEAVRLWRGGHLAVTTASYPWWFVALALGGLAWIGRRRPWPEAFLDAFAARRRRRRIAVLCLLAIALNVGLYAVWGQLETWRAQGPMGMFDERGLLTGSVTGLALAGLALFVIRSATAAWLFGTTVIYLGLAVVGLGDSESLLVPRFLVALCLGAGACATLAGIPRWIGVAERWHGAAAAPAAVACLVFVGWSTRPFSPAETFGPGDGQAFAAALEATGLESSAVLFAHDPLREVVDLYTRFDTVSLAELEAQAGITGPADAQVNALAGDRPLYYLHSLDGSGHRRHTIDPERFRWDRDLVAVARFDRAALGLRYLPEELESVTLYSLRDRVADEQVAQRQIPEGGIAFLRLDPRSAVTNLAVSVEDTPVPVSDAYRLYHPVRHPAAKGTVSLQARGRGLPDLADARLVGWEEPIEEPLVTAEWYADHHLRQQPAGFIPVASPATFLIPVRYRPDTFPVIGLQARAPGPNWRVDVGDRTIERPPGASIYLALTNEVASARATNEWFSVTPGSTGTLELVSYRSELALHRLQIPTDDVTSMVIVYGRLASARPARNNQPWTLLLDREPFATGTCGPDPTRAANAFRALIRCTPGDALELAWEGAGLLDPEVMAIRTRLEIPGHSERVALFPEAFPERAGDHALTAPSFTLPVPVLPGAREYTLTLDADSAGPDPLHLTLALGQREWQARLDPGRESQQLVFENMHTDRPASLELRFETEAVHPAAGSAPARGFRLYNFIWEPSWR